MASAPAESTRRIHDRIRSEQLESQGLHLSRLQQLEMLWAVIDELGVREAAERRLEAELRPPDDPSRRVVSTGRPTRRVNYRARPEFALPPVGGGAAVPRWAED